jgi:NitT/TauT family transport system substrate-binding protein
MKKPREEQKMRNKILLFNLVLILVIALQGCSGSTPTAPQETVKIKVQLLPYLSYAPLYLAQEEGYFAEQGLEVEFLKIQGGSAYVAVIEGEIDVAATFLNTNLISAIYQNSKVKIVADKGYVAPSGCSVNGLLARKSLVDSGGLKDVASLAGKIAKYDNVSIQAFYLDTLLKSGGLSLADVTYVDFNSSPVVMEAFKNGELDVAFESEPWLTRNVDSGNSVIWRDVKDLIPEAQFAVIIFGPNMLEKNPDAGRRFMVAYLKAVRQYNQGKTERNLTLLATFTESEPAFLEKVCWPTIRDDIMINTQTVLDFQKWALENNLIDGEVSLDKIWDPSFVEFAVKNVKNP